MSETPPFLEMEGVPLGDADVAVLCLPYEGTVSYGRGTARGPQAILLASQHLETFDEELGWEMDGNLRICTLPPFAPRSGERPEGYHARLRAACRGMGLAPPFPLGLGGEHSLTPTLLGALRDDLSDVTVVQIDAHADLRPSYHDSVHNHACAMHGVLELGVKRLVAVAIRSAEAQEHRRSAEDPRIDTFYDHELQRDERWEELLGELRGLKGPCYLTIDVDGLEPALCPGTGTPQPGGLSWPRVTALLRALLREGEAQLFGADIMETAPLAGCQVGEMVAAKLGQKILGYRFGPRLSTPSRG